MISRDSNSSASNTVTSDEVREAYYYIKGKKCHFNPAFDGGHDPSSGRTYQDKWSKIADFLNSKNCRDVYGFIYANQILRPSVVDSNYNLKPTQLYSDAAWNAYLEYKEFIKKRIPEQVSADLKVIDTQVKYWKKVSSGDPLYKTLQDDSLSLTAIVRCMLAAKAKYWDIVEKYRKAAEFEYRVASEEYNKVLAGVGLCSRDLGLT